MRKKENKIHLVSYEQIHMITFSMTYTIINFNYIPYSLKYMQAVTTSLPTLGYPVSSNVRVLGSRAGNLEICLRTSSRYPIREKEREREREREKKRIKKLRCRFCL